MHPDTITTRFNRMVDREACRRIRLHDVGHTYHGLARRRHQPKIIGERIGHGNRCPRTRNEGRVRTGSETIAALFVPKPPE
jgi:hypothetical protein